MTRFSWLQQRPSRVALSRSKRRALYPLTRTLTLERLEDRTVLSVFTVVNLSDSDPGSLRAAIAQAANGDEIQFDSSLSGQRIDLTGGALVLNKSLSISGLGASQLAVSGMNSSNVFEILGGVSVSIAGLTIEGGYSDDSTGAGIDNGHGGSLTLTACALTGNSGTGVYNSGGSLTVIACTFWNNSGDLGGAIFNGGSAIVSNSTLAQNSANEGGALYARSGSVLSIGNSTIAGNSATAGGGVYLRPAAFVSITSTIVANNSANDSTPDVSGRVNSSGFNLISNPIGSTGWVSSDLQGEDPLLGPLQDNGGPTLTMAVYPGSSLFGMPASPALNAGAAGVFSPTTDQRGLARSVDGAIDIGAWEFQNLSVSMIVQPVDVVYDQNPHGTTAEAFGPNGEVLAAPQLFYSSGFAPTDVFLDDDNNVLSYTASGYFAPIGDYGEALATATITIRQATPTVVVQAVNVAFDGAAHGTTAQAFGVNGENLGAVEVTYSSGLAPVDAGSYTATATYAGSSNYTSATGSALITISLPNATVVVQPVHVSYDGYAHGTTAQAFDDSNTLLGPATVTYSSGSAPVNAGSYIATGTFVNNAYSSIPGTAFITIDKAPLIVTVQAATKVYGSANPVFTVSYQGFVGNDAPNSLGGQLTFSTTATSSSNVGIYVVSASGLTSNNYDITFVDGSLSINAATLVVSATNANKVYGTAVPPLTYSISGFVNNDTSAVVSGSPIVTTTATAASNVGAYAITIAAGSLSAANYTFVLQNGVLSVTKATPTLTWNTPGSISATTALGSGQLNATANVAGAFVYTPAAGTLLSVGTHTLATTFTPTDSVNYNTATASVSILVTAVSGSGPGITVSGSTLFVVGGASSSDQIQISPTGSSNSGSTGLQIYATLNGVYYSKKFSQFFDAVSIVEGSGNQNMQFASALKLDVTITTGNGHVNICGGSGDFTITLGSGNDNINLGNGNNVIQAGNGNNNVCLGNGANSITLGSGNDNVNLGHGNNVVWTGNGNDNVCLGNGVNSVTLGDGNDSVNGGNGNTVVTAGNGNVNVNLGQGSNTVTLGDGRVNVNLGNGNNVVSAGDGNANVNLGHGSNRVTLGHGNNNVNAGNGANVVIVGNGNDNVNLGNGPNTVDVGHGRNNVCLGNGNNAVTAGNGNDNVNLGNGKNTVTLGDGNDNVNAGNGVNVVSAGNGNVNVNLGNGANAVTLGDGRNNVNSGNGSVVVTAGNGNNNVNLGNGSNTVTLGHGNNTVTLGHGANTVKLGNGNDNVNAGNGNNVITTGSGRSSVNAGNGHNLVAAGLGQNTVRVGNGRNILIDGDVTLTHAGDSLRQVLNDWAQFGAAASNVASIRSRLHVNFNKTYANTLSAGNGLDWFWATYAKDHLNKKAGDLLN